MKVAAPLLAAAVLLAVGACGSDDITVPTDNGDVSVSKDGTDTTIKSDEGAASVGSGKLPDSFPADDIPLIDGQILAAIAVDQSGGVGWSVSILADGAGQDAFTEGVNRLKAAGFREESAMSGGVTTSQLTNGTYRVLIATTDQGEQATVQYAVEKDS